MDRLLLDERILADGRIARCWAAVAGAGLVLSDEVAGAGALPVGAVDRVMCRYGRPLETAVALGGDALDLGGGRRLSRLHYHAPVDATGRDYLVWERPGEAPLAVLATHATAALRYLALRLDGERPQESEG